ncbi:MAG: methyltransferase domain-containing protein [Verrucomicrobia bacterium]|nr:methyltransferase domain-containing protein [Verrucomicrobiota bacterium]
MSGWDPDLYLRFEAYRTRAAADLLSRVELEEPRFVVDLGCGPGNSTALLAKRWPSAAITGVDNSAAMLGRARAAYPGINWIQADLAGWRPPDRQDFIFANASLQWVPDHRPLLQGFCNSLRTGGVLAFQVPSIHHQPAAEVYHRLADTPPWRAFRVPDERLTVETPSFYHDVLASWCRHVEIWETVYHHLLENHEQMVLWYRSTGLRPFLENLPDEAARSAFIGELVNRYRARFPALADGQVLFPFHRLFVLATR